MRYFTFLLATALLISLTAGAIPQPPVSGNNRMFREVSGAKFEIIDTAGFILYYRYETEWAGKGSSMIRKGKYYFSSASNSEIMPLTLANLEKTFSADTKFRYALEAAFREDRELPAYDKYLQRYKVNSLYCLLK